MNAKPDTEAKEIADIAICLANKFVKPLLGISVEKNYLSYTGCLLQILEWADEFYAQYNYILEDWQTFKQSKANIYHAINKEDFLLAWADKKLEQFTSKNKGGENKI